MPHAASLIRLSSSRFPEHAGKEIFIMCHGFLLIIPADLTEGFLRLMEHLLSAESRFRRDSQRRSEMEKT